MQKKLQKILLNLIIKWEKVRENEKNFKKIIWKTYNDDKNYFEETNLKNKSKKNFDKAQEVFNLAQSQLKVFLEEIDMPDAGENMGLYSIGAYVN